MSCPYPQCVGMPGPGDSFCPGCGGPLVMCPACAAAAPNRVHAAYCRFCGAPMRLEPAPWPQSGGAETRVCAGSGVGPAARLLSGLEWFVPKVRVLLEPVILSDRVLVLEQSDKHDERGDQLAAYSLGQGGNRLWSCDTFFTCPPAPPPLCTPACAGSFAYVFTPNPNRIHRVDLSTGSREVVAPVINGDVRVELPGTLCLSAAPLLFAAPGGANDSETTLCALLSEEGLLFLELPKRQRGGGVATVQAHAVPCDLRGGRWSSPALLKNTLLSTDTASGRFLRADIEFYPRRVDVTPGKMDRFHQFSPCMARDGGADRILFAWTALDQNNRLHLVRLFPEGDEMSVSLNMSGAPARPVRCGTGICVPGVSNEHGHTLAVISASPEAVAHQRLTGAIGADRLVCVHPGGAGGNALCFVARPGTAAQFWLGANNEHPFPPYPPGQQAASPSAQPVAGRGKVIVGTDMGLFCYS